MAALKKSGLGRGLGSLFGEIEEAQKPVPVEKPKAAKPAPAKAQSNSKKMESAEPAATGDAVIYVKVADIKPNAAQPRKVFDEDALADLAASIKEHGLIQPVILRKAKKVMSWLPAKDAGEQHILQALKKFLQSSVSLMKKPMHYLLL